MKSHLCSAALCLSAFILVSFPGWSVQATPNPQSQASVSRAKRAAYGWLRRGMPQNALKEVEALPAGAQKSLRTVRRAAWQTKQLPWLRCLTRKRPQLAGQVLKREIKNDLIKGNLKDAMNHVGQALENKELQSNAKLQKELRNLGSLVYLRTLNQQIEGGKKILDSIKGRPLQLDWYASAVTQDLLALSQPEADKFHILIPLLMNPGAITAAKTISQSLDQRFDKAISMRKAEAQQIGSELLSLIREAAKAQVAQEKADKLAEQQQATAAPPAKAKAKDKAPRRGFWRRVLGL